MWSFPSYDPNLVAVHDNKLAGEILEFLNADPGKPTLANAYQERYMPGSTFKVITTGIALENGLINFDSAWRQRVRVSATANDRPSSELRRHCVWRRPARGFQAQLQHALSPASLWNSEPERWWPALRRGALARPVAVRHSRCGGVNLR